jgi:predicted secreted protein
MGITSGLVLFAVIWSMVFLIALPIRVQTQGDTGKIIPGTHSGAPEQHHLKRKALWTTLVSILLWIVIAGIILSGWIGVDDLEGWLNPAGVAARGTGG